jgi:hypothetical protein
VEGGAIKTHTIRRRHPPLELNERTAELADLYHAIFGEVRRPASGHVQDRLADREIALAALQALSPALAVGYADWVRVGMALHAVGNDGEMLAAWDSWSKSCSEKYQDGACEKKWRSFGTKGGLSLGSLIFWARQNGWTPPGRCRQVESSAKADADVLGRLDSVLADGAEALFHDRPLLEALGRLAETDRPEFACVRTKVKNAKVSLSVAQAGEVGFLLPMLQLGRDRRWQGRRTGGLRPRATNRSTTHGCPGSPCASKPDVP